MSRNVIDVWIMLMLIDCLEGWQLFVRCQALRLRGSSPNPIFKPNS